MSSIIRSVQFCRIGAFVYISSLAETAPACVRAAQTNRSFRAQWIIYHSLEIPILIVFFLIITTALPLPLPPRTYELTALEKSSILPLLLYLKAVPQQIN